MSIHIVDVIMVRAVPTDVTRLAYLYQGCEIDVNSICEEDIDWATGCHEA
jgi:hypothetical protein